MKIEKSLFFDDLDVFIIKQLVACMREGKENNTWLLAKLFVSESYGKDVDKIYSIKKAEVDSLYRKIQRRINKYVEHDLVTINLDENGDEEFNLDTDLVTVAKHKFSNGYKECLILRL